MNRRAYVVALAFAATAAACNGKSDETATVPNVAPNPGPGAAAVRPDDSQIATRIRGQYFASPDIKAQAISVDVKDGVASLEGTVATEQAHTRALEIARSVDGVKSVDDRLTVDPAVAQTARQTDERSPGWTTTKIQAKYFLNPDVGPWSVDVTTSEDGVVTLAGTVDSAEDKEKALQIARDTEGVTGVNDQLRIERETAATTGSTDAAGSGTAAAAVSDAWITSKIQSKYFLDPDVKGRNIDVNTKQGVVTLTGDVGSYSERRQAASKARQTEGVREVRDELRVNAAMGDATRGGGRNIDDEWIKTKLQSKFFAESDLRGHHIDVRSQNGVVTISGTVTSADAKATAAQLARDTDGVQRVVDQITVQGAPK